MDTPTALQTIKAFIQENNDIKTFISEHDKIPEMSPETEQKVIDILDEKELYCITDYSATLSALVTEKLICILLRKLHVPFNIPKLMRQEPTNKYLTATIMTLGDYVFAYMYRLMRCSVSLSSDPTVQLEYDRKQYGCKLKKCDMKYKGYYRLILTEITGNPNKIDWYNFERMVVKVDMTRYEKDQKERFMKIDQQLKDVELRKAQREKELELAEMTRDIERNACSKIKLTN